MMVKKMHCVSDNPLLFDLLFFRDASYGIEGFITSCRMKADAEV